MIAVEHLTKRFGRNLVLDDISETIREGEKVVVIGPSGSGKSTFLRCLNLLEQPTKVPSPLTAPSSPIPRWISTPSAARWAWCSSTSTSSPT